MPSQLQDTNLSDLKWADLTDAQLIDIRDNDDRETAKAKAATLFEERNLPDPNYDPRSDPGPVRYEDSQPVDENYETAELSAEEVPLEDSRRDETTLLATDTVREDDNGELVIVKH